MPDETTPPVASEAEDAEADRDQNPAAAAESSSTFTDSEAGAAAQASSPEGQTASTANAPDDVNPTEQTGNGETSGETISVQTVEFSPLEKQPFGDADSTDGNGAAYGLGLLHDVPLQITVELGRTQMPVKEILALRHGSVVELERLAGEPVDVRVNDRLIARGEVVVIEDKFGIRILEIILEQDRSPVSRFGERARGAP